MIANHLVAKLGDEGLDSRFQPPTRSSEAQRIQQAQAVNAFVKQLLAVDKHADVVALGDLNDCEFSPALATLTDGGVLTDLIDTLPVRERYSYDYEGNSEVLDHILTSPAIRQARLRRGPHQRGVREPDQRPRSAGGPYQAVASGGSAVPSSGAVSLRRDSAPLRGFPVGTAGVRARAASWLVAQFPAPLQGHTHDPPKPRPAKDPPASCGEAPRSTRPRTPTSAAPPPFRSQSCGGRGDCRRRRVPPP